MEVTAEDLRQHYETLHDEVLMELYANNELDITEKKSVHFGLLFPIFKMNFNVSGKLTEIAASILKEVLTARGITENQLRIHIIETQIKAKEIKIREREWIEKYNKKVERFFDSLFAR